MFDVIIASVVGIPHPTACVNDVNGTVTVDSVVPPVNVYFQSLSPVFVMVLGATIFTSYWYVALPAFILNRMPVYMEQFVGLNVILPDVAFVPEPIPTNPYVNTVVTSPVILAAYVLAFNPGACM
jgi:hypothetical protein